MSLNQQNLASPANRSAEAASANGGTVIYRPRRIKMFLFGAVFTVFGILVAALALNDYANWAAQHETATSIFKVVKLSLGAFVFLLLGLPALACALLGLPRLTVTSVGIRVERLFGQQWAEWGSLSAFELTSHSGRKRSTVATANVDGTAASNGLLRARKLILGNFYAVPIATIVADLNARRAKVPGVSPSAPVAADGRKYGVAGFKVPWLTYFILGVLIEIFIAEQLFAVDPSSHGLRPSLHTLLALGGLNSSLVLSKGEWYRLLTAPLLHGDLLHIVANGIALLLAGYLLEKTVGRAWFFAIFVIGALGGSLMSLIVNPSTIVSVGASGAIMGLFAAAFVSSFRMPPATRERTRLQLGSVRILIPSLLPLFNAPSGSQIDYGAHAGGALAGTLVAIFLVKTWPDSAALPRYRLMVSGIILIAALLFVESGAAVANRYPVYKAVATLIPETELPKTQADGQARSEDLIARYPQDPRSHLYRAAALEAAQDDAAAERELRTALTQAQGLRFVFPIQFDHAVRAMLAVVLFHEGQNSQAEEMAKGICQSGAEDERSKEIRALLADSHLCG